MELLIVIIVLALVFDFINGFHDAANSIATVVSTKVLTPFQAVLWAAFFNFVAYFIFKDHAIADTVAKTVKIGVVASDSGMIIILSGLIAAITWNLATWWYGIPSSSSHTLIGGFAGAAIAHGGFSTINSEPILKTAAFIVVAPLTGMLMAYIISVWFLNSFRKGPIIKLFSAAVMILVVWFVYSSMEFKKDFNGGTSYSMVFDSKIGKDKIKKATSFKDDAGKEFAPVVSAGKDSLGNKDKTGTIYTVKTLFMKKSGEADVNAALTEKLSVALQDLKVNYAIVESHRITEASPEKERFDISHLKVDYDSYFLKVLFHGANFKWILLGAILMVFAIFSLFLSSISPRKATSWFRRLQLVSSGAFSIGHGGNDAQKVMGIIAAALIAGGEIKSIDEMPTWVPLACYAAIGLGTLSGGWKIVKTMGSKITKVTPFEGVAAETAGAVTLFLAENLKIPVSTTHVITGAIIGVGATKRLSAVRWGVTINLLWAWILTIPVSATIAGLVYMIAMRLL